MQRFKDRFQAMGTWCEAEIFARDAVEAELAFEHIRDDVHRLEKRYSRYRSDSVLTDINRVAACGGSLEVDAETASLLHYAQACFEQSDGLFDITSGILRRAWRFPEGPLPREEYIEELLAHVGWNRLRWDSPWLSFPDPGLEIDLGGIVKEYAADRAVALARQAGIEHGYVNLGGDLSILGPQFDGAPWLIGIRHPREPSTLLTTLELSSGALATSGDYERCILIDGNRYGHILNPHTGWPVRELATVTVHAGLCVVAGSMATIGMLKEDQGPNWLNKMATESIWMRTNGELGGSLGATSSSR